MSKRIPSALSCFRYLRKHHPSISHADAGALVDLIYLSSRLWGAASNTHYDVNSMFGVRMTQAEVFRRFFGVSRSDVLFDPVILGDCLWNDAVLALWKKGGRK